MRNKCTKITQLHHNMQESATNRRTFPLHTRPTADILDYGCSQGILGLKLCDYLYTWGIVLRHDRWPRALGKVGMPRWFWFPKIAKKSGKNEMSGYEKNILSDPTSDGNIHEESGEVPPPGVPSPVYEEFDRRPISEHDSDSLTQTCPTCGGTGKLTKGASHYKLHCFIESLSENERKWNRAVL